MFSDESSFLSLDDIEYICDKTFGMLKIPIFFFNSSGIILFKFSYKDSNNPLYSNTEQLLNDFLSINDENTPINIKSTMYHENYFIIKVITSDNISGTLLVGPTISSEIDEKSINSIIKKFDILIKYKGSLINYYNNIVIMDFNSFIDAGLLLYHSIYHDKLDFTNVVNIDEMLIDVGLKDSKAFYISNSKKRRNSRLHHSQEFERKLLKHITDGNLEEVIKFLKYTTFDGELGINSKNPLRNLKNIFISYTSIVSRAAIEKGLAWEVSLTLTDFYFEAVEELNTIKDINELFLKMILDYTEHVNKVKMYNYSSAILKCQKYIFEHLYEKISLSILADYSSMNPCYLSHLFKKEVGVSISDYIQKERIEESKKLILSGKKSLVDIYVPLGFIDQSHFSKTFKKFVGITPKEYKTLYFHEI
ncbi:helix-turn-helix domain-containing protein [Clostridium tertium]|uniref:helix-turn-helix domain-containing protein n=1 Tax=Clostridium tertium TaxID=1559 RepID=UPI001C1DF63A|nr:helix-turn-helix domain-containing protein [Clostridium tertium]MBU6135433.1 helix-turn-helix domain-containing protein [Clostridium tertium]